MDQEADAQSYPTIRGFSFVAFIVVVNGRGGAQTVRRKSANIALNVAHQWRAANDPRYEKDAQSAPTECALFGFITWEEKSRDWQLRTIIK